jgi:histidinol-phosphate aminotransferase
MYPVYSKMFGADARVLSYARTSGGPFLDGEAIIDVVRELRPKLVCLPNPDSPTGTVLEPAMLRRILDACEAADAVLFLDEAYHPFHDWSAVGWTQTSQNLIVARTFAKAWGVAGLRVGYAVAHPDTIALLHKMRPMYEVSTLAVEFVSAMLDHVPAMMQTVERIKEGREYFLAEMRRLGFDVLPTAANFAHVAFGERGSAVHAALAGKVYYRTAFTDECLAGYSRFTIATRPIMTEVVALIQEAVGDGEPSAA